MTLTLSKIPNQLQTRRRIFLRLGLSDSFQDFLQVCLLGRNITQVRWVLLTASHQVKHDQVTPSLMLLSDEERAVCQVPPLWSYPFCSIINAYFEQHYFEAMSVSSSNCNSSINLFTYICMYSCFPIFLNGLTALIILIYYDAQMVSDLGSGSPSGWLLGPLDTSPSMFTFPCFLAQDGPSSSCTFPALESAISLRSPIPFSGKWYL